jgi:hypothetical protein
MAYTQIDMFERAPRAREKTSPEVLDRVRERLEATLARLEAETSFCWKDELAAIHEENGFRAAAKLLGDEGETLWQRFDTEMDRLYATVGSHSS